MIQPLPVPDAVLDRDCENRQAAEYLDQVQARGTHRIMVLRRGATLVRENSIVYLSPEDIPAAAAPALTIYLGSVGQGQHPGNPPLAAGTDLVLLVLTDDDDPLAWVPDGTSLTDYRSNAVALSAADRAVFIEAQAIANWHLSHPRCPRCGGPTVIRWSGWMRRCSRDGSEHFPRTDPAVIVAIVGEDDRILLAGNANWEDNRYSTVAGFVEAGETAEQAVLREIHEEVGVRLHSPSYVGSQSWPFPRSLMLGFLARTSDTVAVPDGVEVVRARWFTRADLQAAVRSGEVIISHRRSIARSLIEHWYGGPIQDAGEPSIDGRATPMAPEPADPVGPDAAGIPGSRAAGGRS